MPSPFLQALAAMNSEDEDRKPRISHVGQVALLREFHSRYRAPMPFKIGDLVTAREDGGVIGAGEPCIVLEIDPTANFCFVGEAGSNRFGRKLNIRIARLLGSDVAMVWSEAVDFEPYTGDGVDALAAE